MIRRIQAAVTPARLQQQAIVVGSSMPIFAGTSPWIVEHMQGVSRWLSVPNFFGTLGVVTLLSAVPVYFLRPLSHYLQHRGSPLKNFIGFLATIPLETAYSVLGYWLLSPHLGWDFSKAVVGALWQGPSRMGEIALFNLALGAVVFVMRGEIRGIQS